MRTALLFLLLLLQAPALPAQQISEVRNEDNYIVVYDSKGNRVSSMFNTGNKQVVAVAEGFFVTQDDWRIITWDANCKQLGSMSSSSRKVLSASGSTFTVEEFIGTATYDSSCKEIDDNSIDPQVIGKVRLESTDIVVYNAAGSRISSMTSSFNRQVVAYTGTFFIIREGSWYETYDAQCNRLGSMSALGIVEVRGASGSTFTTLESGGWVVTYDSKCSRISTRSE